MRTITILLMLSLVPTAAANGDHALDMDLDLEMHDGGGEFWFQLAGSDERNPTITLQPGAEVNVTVTNEGTVGHDLHFDLDGDGESDVSSDDTHGGDLASGETAEFSFTVPEDAHDGEYWCSPHRTLGMGGDVHVDGHGDEDEESPGLAGWAAIMVLVAAVALMRRR